MQQQQKFISFHTFIRRIYEIEKQNKRKGKIAQRIKLQKFTQNHMLTQFIITDVINNNDNNN